MQMLARQPHVLVAELKKATLPHQKPPAPREPSRLETVMSFLALIPLLGMFFRVAKADPDQPAPPRIGIPHGVEKVRVRAENVGVDGDEIVFCHSRRYQALQHVQEDDGRRYPKDPEKVEVIGDLPAKGYYNAILTVSVNGSVCVGVEFETTNA